MSFSNIVCSILLLSSYLILANLISYSFLDLTTVPTSTLSEHGEISPMNNDQSLNMRAFALLSRTPDKLDGIILSKD